MRKRSLALAIPLLLAGCASTAGSPSAPAASVAAPSVAASPAASPSASAVPSASAAPSEAAASENPWTAYRETTLQPGLDELSASLTAWGEAFATAAAPGAPDTAKIALSNAAFRVRTALASAPAEIAAAPPPECGTDATGQVSSFFEKLTKDSTDLLANADANADALADAQALVKEAADGLPAVTSALDEACA